MKIPYVNIAAQHAPIQDELLSSIREVIRRSDFILGHEVDVFERRFADLCGVRFSIGVNSGTDALILALRALNIGPGDEVITVPNSFVASTSCIMLTGARPVFVDVSEDYNINPHLIKGAITPRTKAILPVHLTGQPADMEPLMEIARMHDLHVIEDCAQAVCAEYKGQKVGSFGTVGCFSFHPLKTLNACGDGGIITTNDETIYEKIRILRNLGLRTRDDCVVWSGNSRLDSLQAAILLVKLNYLNEWTEKRRANAKHYREHLSPVAAVKAPLEHENTRAVYHTFVIQAERRDELKAYLEKRGIGTAIHYPVPIHLHSAAASLGYRRGDFPVTERQAQHILSLPIYPEMGIDDLDFVMDSIKEFYQKI